MDRHPQRCLNGGSMGLSVLIGGITFETLLSNRAERVGAAVPENQYSIS